MTDQTDPVASKLNSVRKYVASRTLQRAEWHNTTVIPGDVAAYVGELKAQPGGEIQVAGSSGLIQTLVSHDLVDGYARAGAIEYGSLEVDEAGSTDELWKANEASRGAGRGERRD